ncbi:MAG: Gfo/Idh/MocA family protein, partial [Armatimonadota bacterium]
GYVAHGDRPGYYDCAVDILHCHGVHYLDTLRWLGGDVTQITSQVRASEREFATGWYALTQHEGGCSGAVMLNWQAGGPRPWDFEMHGRGISVFASLRGGARVLIEGEERPDLLADFAPIDGDPTRHFGFREENRHFVDCLLDGRQPLTNLADATRSMELAEQIYLAAR